MLAWRSTVKTRQTLVACTLAITSLAVSAHQYALGKLTIVHPHALATVAGQSMGGVFMTIENAGEGDALVQVSSAIVPRAALHSMAMDQGIMRMREIARIEIPAKSTVELKQQAGAHIMLEGLKAPLVAGQTFPMKLKFEKAGEIAIDVHIEALDAHSHAE